MEIIRENVEKILEARIRPAVQMDGGNVELVDIQDDNIYVKLVGACASCPSSTITLRMGIEGVLREEFPDLRELIAV